MTANTKPDKAHQKNLYVGRMDDLKHFQFS